MKFLIEWEETAYYSAEVEAESEAEAREKFDTGEYTAELGESIMEDESTFTVTELKEQLTKKVHFYSLPMGSKTIPDVGILHFSENLLKYSL